MKRIFSLICVVILSACAAPQKQEPVVVVVEDVAVETPHYTQTPSEIFSSQDVIVYPVTGDWRTVTQTFPEYQGVVGNTTAGGYTVFDQSVTVYPVEVGQVKPAYLPDYAVPKYINNAPTQIRSNQALLPVYQGEEPINIVQPRRAQRLTQYDDMPVANQTTVSSYGRGNRTMTGEQRKSSPILTRYE